MVDVETNSNSIYIPAVQSGCMKTEFDLQYPSKLNGIINPEEFQKSIYKINDVINSRRKTLGFLRIFLSVSIIVGVALIVISSMIRKSKNGASLFLSLSITGIVITAVGAILYGTTFCIIQIKRIKRMRQVIAEESIKYSSRSPISCNWRLEGDHLVIDTGHLNLAKTDDRVFYSNQSATELK